MNVPKFDVLKFSPDPTRQSMPLAERVRQLEVDLAEIADQRDKLREEAKQLSKHFEDWCALVASWCRLMREGGPQ